MILGIGYCAAADPGFYAKDEEGNIIPGLIAPLDPKGSPATGFVYKAANLNPGKDGVVFVNVSKGNERVQLRDGTVLFGTEKIDDYLKTPTVVSAMKLSGIDHLTFEHGLKLGKVTNMGIKSGLGIGTLERLLTHLVKLDMELGVVMKSGEKQKSSFPVPEKVLLDEGELLIVSRGDVNLADSVNGQYVGHVVFKANETGQVVLLDNGNLFMVLPEDLNLAMYEVNNKYVGLIIMKDNVTGHHE